VATLVLKIYCLTLKNCADGGRDFGGTRFSLAWKKRVWWRLIFDEREPADYLGNLGTQGGTHVAAKSSQKIP
jgi:hypothetical protein